MYNNLKLFHTQKRLVPHKSVHLVACSVAMTMPDNSEGQRQLHLDLMYFVLRPVEKQNMNELK